MVFCNVLGELVNVDQAMPDVHTASIVDSGDYEALVEAEMVDRAVGQREVHHLLGGQVA